MKVMSIVIAALVVMNISLLAEGKKYGKDLTLKEKTQISKILENPKNYVGKRVLVEGTIVDVCSKRGCWMDVASDKEFQKMKVKVKDGEIVFPMESKGKTALVEGEVYEIKMTKEQALEYGMEQAKEKGTKFDPKSVNGPITLYQIKGIGAVIK